MGVVIAWEPSSSGLMLASIGHADDTDVGILLAGVSAGDWYVHSGKGSICLHHSLSNSNEGITDGHLRSPIDCGSKRKSSVESCECATLAFSILPILTLSD